MFHIGWLKAFFPPPRPSWKNTFPTSSGHSAAATLQVYQLAITGQHVPISGPIPCHTVYFNWLGLRVFGHLTSDSD
jgi:hypothetical protein